MFPQEKLERTRSSDDKKSENADYILLFCWWVLSESKYLT